MDSSKATKYLILGNGAAAVNAVEAIRLADADGTITLLAREGQHVYSRPLISYRLGGKVDEGRMDYRGRDFYEKHRVTAILGVEATRIDAQRRMVVCSDGREFGFEKLLIATGGSPIRPPIPGMVSGGVFTFTTWDDERRIDQYIRQGGLPHGAVVLGGGLIGLKTVEALVDRKVAVTIVELADRILAVTFDKQASKLAEKALAAKGVGIRTNTTVKEVIVVQASRLQSGVTGDAGRMPAPQETTAGRMPAPQGIIRGVLLSDGQRLDCDMLIVAIGVRPDLSLTAGSGIKTDRGIVVDDRQATNINGIYAAGDVAQGRDALTGESRPIPILPAAARQGRIAGTNMAGGKASYEGGVPMNAVDVVGLPTISVGQTVEQPGDEVLAVLDEEQSTYRKLVLRRGRLVGAILIGRIERAGIFTGLIRSRLDVSDFREHLLSDEFGLLTLPADYRAHMVRGAGIEV